MPHVTIHVNKAGPGQLPQVCYVCGEPAECEREYLHQHVNGIGRYIPGMLRMLFVESRKIYFPMCLKHRFYHHWSLLPWLIPIVMVFVSTGVMFMGAKDAGTKSGDRLLNIGMLLLLLTFLSIFVQFFIMRRLFTFIHYKSKEQVMINNAPDGFVEAIQSVKSARVKKSNQTTS